MFDYIYTIGIKNCEESDTHRLKIFNLLMVLAIGFSLIYCCYYFFILKTYPAGIMSIAIIFLYLIYYPLLLNGHIKMAKIWGFSVYLLQILLITIFFFSIKSGFQLYFVLIIPTVFLLFEPEENLPKYILSFLALILFHICEFKKTAYYPLEISDSMYRILYLTSTTSIGLIIMLIVAFFIKEIHNKDTLLQKLAKTDPLTGLLNRREFMSVSSIHMDMFRRHERKFTIMMADIDNFKVINDTYGHDVGDIILHTLAGSLKQNVRSTDAVGRFGGEEFIFLMPETDIYSGFKKAEEIRKYVSENPIYINPKLTISLTISIGVAEISSISDSVDNIIKNADIALYSAKKSGRNMSKIYSDFLSEEI